MKIKILFFLLIFNITLYSNDQRMARYYIVKANEALRNGDIKLAKSLLEQSYGYYNLYPEYYYLQNQLIEPKRESLFEKNKNSQKILKYIENQFLINKYTMLKDAFLIFKKTLDYNNALFTFSKISNITDFDTLEDYIYFMELLSVFEDYNNLEKIILEAKSKYESLDIDFYFLLLSAKKRNIAVNEFIKKLEILQANNYSLTALLYLKTLFYNDSKSIQKIFLEYNNLKNNSGIEPLYRKDIIFNLILNSSSLNKKDQQSLLNDWVNFGGINDVRTDIILKNPTILNLIKNNKNFSNKFLLFDGIRTKDIDRDNNWEEYYEYKNGVLFLAIFDNNQDGLYESKIEYSNNRVKAYYQYFNETNDKYKKYNFNINDNSISSIEYYVKNLKKRVNLIKSSIKPDLTKFNGLEEKNILNNIDNIEYFEQGYEIERYKNGLVTVKLIDKDMDSFYETREEYKNGVKEKVLKDLNKNGFFEIIEIYSNNKLNTIFYSNDESTGKYDYKEIINGNNVTKYWDSNLDKIYEICVEQKDNLVLTKFDINFDGIYDIIYEQKQNVNNVYKLEKNQYRLINSYKNYEKAITKGWFIVSPRDLDKIEIPDDIDIRNYKNISGFFYYKNNRYYFENGTITKESINFKIFLLENKIYLIDQMGAR